MKNIRSLTLVLMLLAALGLGCSTINKLRSGLEGKPANSADANSNSSSPIVDSEPGSPVAGTDPKAEIIAASKKFTSLSSFKAKMTSEGESPLNLELEYQAPNRYHLKSEPVHGIEVETIMIGPDTYAKFGGKWQKMPGNAGAQIPAMKEMFTEEGIKRLTNVRFEGVEDVNGQPANKYAYDDPGQPDKGVGPFTSTIWVSKAEDIPVQVKVNYSSGKLKSATITYDTSSPVSIEKPI